MAYVLIATDNGVNKYKGNSIDTKPSSVPNGSRCFETDTRRVWVYDSSHKNPGTNTNWWPDYVDQEDFLDLLNDSVNDAQWGENVQEINTINSKISTFPNLLDATVKAINHRGYNTIAPENTLPAYELSKAMGYSYVECDISWTSDGIPVLLHDDTIDRTSDGTGSITSITLENVKILDFGSWKDVSYTGTQIPTFEEFIILCKKLNLHPYIELKGTITADQATILTNIVKRYSMLNKVTWISFVLASLQAIVAKDTNANLGYVVNTITTTTISEAASLITSTNKVFLDGSSGGITAALVTQAMQSNVSVEAWTVDNDLEAYNLMGYGVNGITTNMVNVAHVPQAIKEVLLAYWKMDETTGTTVTDYSGNGYHATMHGTITSQTGLLANSGNALKGNGSNGYISTPLNMSNMSNFKVEFYLKWAGDAVSGWRSIISSYRNAANAATGWFILTYNGAIQVRVITVSHNYGIDPTYTLISGTTYKISFEYNGMAMIFKIWSVSNGVLTEVVNTSLAQFGNLTADNLPVNILASNATTPSEFSPYIIDNVKFTTIVSTQ